MEFARRDGARGNRIQASAARTSRPPAVAAIEETHDGAQAGGMLSFEASAMRRTFDRAIEAAQAENVWRSPAASTEPWADFLDLFRR